MSRGNVVVMRSSNEIPISICYERKACEPFDLYPGDVIWDDNSECDMIVVGVGVSPPFAKNFIWLTAQQRQLRQGVIGRGKHPANITVLNVRRASAHVHPETAIHELLSDPQLIPGGLNELKHTTTTPMPSLSADVQTPQLPTFTPAAITSRKSEKCTIRIYLPVECDGECITSQVSGSTTIENFLRKLVDRLYKQLGLNSPAEGGRYRLSDSPAGTPIASNTPVEQFSQLYLVSPSSPRQSMRSGGSVAEGTVMRYWIADDGKWSVQHVFVFVVKDIIYWCKPGDRSMSNECSIRMIDIREICKGPLCPHAKRANTELCFSVITKQNLCVHFEAQSLQDLAMWLQYLSLPPAEVQSAVPVVTNSVLAKGASFQRFHIYNEQPTSTPVVVYCQNERLIWKQSERQEDSIALRDITFIQLGRSNGIFLSVFAQDIDPARCFSITASSNSLHLVAASRTQVEEWLNGLRKVLGSLGRVLTIEESQDGTNPKYKVVLQDSEGLESALRTHSNESHVNDHISKQFAAKAWRLLDVARQSSSQLLLFGCSVGALSTSVLYSIHMRHAEVMHVSELDELVAMSKAVLFSSIPTFSSEIAFRLARSKLPWVLSLDHGPLTRDRLQFCVDLALIGPSAVLGSPEAISALWLCLSNAEPPEEVRRVVNEKANHSTLEERFASPRTLRRPSQFSRQARAAHSLQPVQVQVGITETELYEYTFDFEVPLEMHLLCICEMCGLDKSEAEFQALYHLRHRCYITEEVIGKNTCSVVFSDVLILRNQALEAQSLIKSLRRYQKEYERDCELSRAAQLRGETRAEWHERRAAEAKRREETDRLIYMAMSEPSLLDSLSLDPFAEELIANDGIKLFVEALKWVPSPERAGRQSTSKILLESIGILICFESALELLEDEGIDFLYDMVHEHSAFLVREGLMLLKTVLDLAINGFVMVHTAAQRVAHKRSSMVYMRPIELLNNVELQATSLVFFNSLIEKASTDMIRLSLLQALDRAGLFQALEQWPRGKSASTAQELHKFRELTVSFRSLGPALDFPVVEENSFLLRVNQDAVNLASFLTKNSSLQRHVVVTVAHTSSSFVTDGHVGVHCLNGPAHLDYGVGGVDALIAAFLSCSLQEVSPVDTVASACAIFAQCQTLSRKEGRPSSSSASTVDELYRFNREQAAHTLWFKRCAV